MRIQTRGFIEQLAQLKWCANCGRLATPRSDWIAVSNYPEALGNAASDDWLSFRLMISNRMHRDLSRIDYGRFSQWNKNADEIQTLVKPIVERASSLWLGERKASKQDVLSLAWDIQGGCVEMEFSDVMAPIFFLPRLFECYQMGHRPCGWGGPRIDERWAGVSNDPIPPGNLYVY